MNAVRERIAARAVSTQRMTRAARSVAANHAIPSVSAHA